MPDERISTVSPAERAAWHTERVQRARQVCEDAREEMNRATAQLELLLRPRCDAVEVDESYSCRCRLEDGHDGEHIDHRGMISLHWT